MVFELHRRDGVASVIPWRPSDTESARKEYLPRFDRHGIPHCKHSESTFHRFQHDAGVELDIGQVLDGIEWQAEDD